MEIVIIQKGERIGPLSEEQVRQYLDDGLASPNDLASYEGMEDWLPLELVLAHLPSFTPKTETAPAGESASAPAAVAKSESGEDESSFIRPNASANATVDEPNLSLTASQKTKRKVSKIVIQPILPLETTLPLKRKPATGKTALTLEPLRPTTSLPPVTGHLPRVKKAAKGTIKTGQLSFGDFGEKPAAPTASAPPPAVLPATTPPDVAPPKPQAPPSPQAPALLPPPLPAPSPLASDIRRASPPWQQRLPGWALYVAVALVLLLISLVILFIYLTANRGETPDASASATSAPAPAAIQSPPADPVTASDFTERGSRRQAKGDLDGAIADYTQALTLDPKAVETYYQRGLARQATGDLAGAATDYTQVIALNPKRANAFSNRGYIKQGQHDFDGALADYDQALRIDPKISVAYYNVGLIKVQKGDLDGAIDAYNRALECDPKMAFAYYNRGVAKNTEGDVDGALADYTQALTLDPTIARAYCDRGVARQAKGDADGAVADYTKALSLNPKMGDAYYNRGLIELQKGDFDAAIADNTQVIDLDPKYAQAYNRRGLALYGKGSLDQALDDLKQFCALDPRDAGTDAARLYIWVISTRQNPAGDADATLSTAVLNDWNSPPEDLTSIIASFLLGHIDENKLIANAASPDPNREPGQYCRVWYFAGIKRLLAGDTATAAGCFQKSVFTSQKGLNEYNFSQTQLRLLNSSTEVAAKPDAGP